MDHQLDERDSRIISLLRADPTILNSRISDQLGVSNATVSARIKKLRDLGVVRVVASTDIRAAGFETWAMVSAQFEPTKQDTCETVAMRLAQMPQVVAIGTPNCTGNKSCSTSWAVMAPTSTVRSPKSL